MIVKSNTSWYQDAEPLTPFHVTGTQIDKLYTIVKRPSAGVTQDKVVFPHCSEDPICVYEVGQLDNSVSLIQGTYSNMCKVGNTLYPTERRTSKTWKAYDYDLYDPYLHVYGGTAGADGSPAFYRWDHRTSNPGVRHIRGVGVSWLVAMRQTDADMITGFVTTYRNSDGAQIAQPMVSVSTSDSNRYFYVKYLGVDVTVNGSRYGLYSIGIDNLNLVVSESEYRNYVDMSVGVRFSSITSRTVFIIMKGLVGLCRPGNQPFDT